MDANTLMLARKEEVKRRDMETEAMMVAMMRKKFAEDEAKERMEEDHRWKNKLHHKDLIRYVVIIHCQCFVLYIMYSLSFLSMYQYRQQLEDRRNMFDDEKALEAEIAAENVRREDYRKKVVQEARKRLLEEHAMKLQGFLPGTVFTDADEYREYYPPNNNGDSSRFK